MKKAVVFSILLIFFAGRGVAESQDKGMIKGRVFDATTKEPVAFASIVVFGTNIGTISDFDGNFVIAGINPGFVQLQVSFVGYQPYVSESFMVSSARNVFV